MWLKQSLRVLMMVALMSAAFVAASAPGQAAQYTMCAFRSGPQGPCTCKIDGGQAGEFTVVRKSFCRKKSPQEAATPKETAPDATPQDVSAAPQASPGPSEDVTPAAAPAVPAITPRSKLDAVRARGKLRCGVNTGLIGFSSQNAAGTWVGLDADFCRAVAAAALGNPEKIEFVPLETSARFDALKSGEVDLLVRNTTWTMDREMVLGLAFAGVLYFDGQGFLTNDERGLVSAQQLAGYKVCVESGTTSHANMLYYFKAHQIEAETKTFATREEMLKAYLAGECEAYSGDRSSLYADRASFSDPSKHSILPEVISKEPLAPAVMGEDLEWAGIVRWTLSALINAEEVGLDRASAASNQPLTDDPQRLVEGAGVSGAKLRLSKSWLRDVIAASGNYGEMFETNLGKSSPLGMSRSINALWKRGGIQYAPPMW